jgi:hypothetical protein
LQICLSILALQRPEYPRVSKRWVEDFYIPSRDRVAEQPAWKCCNQQGLECQGHSQIYCATTKNQFKKAILFRNLEGDDGVAHYTDSRVDSRWQGPSGSSPIHLVRAACHSDRWSENRGEADRAWYVWQAFALNGSEDRSRGVVDSCQNKR